MPKEQTSLPSLLQMRGITKSFPGVKALQEVDFDLQGGRNPCLARG